MCGLNGILAYADNAPPVDQGELLRTREHMIKRGPDGAGLWISEDRRIGLGHRRLAIIDLSEDGAQPMASADARYHIVFNGEIYNYRELRAQLEASGARFRSMSDTEVILQLYAREGERMCARLRGMYAVAIWDAYEQSLFLARDPFGIKPLYLHDDGRQLRFASQVKALLAGGAIAAEPEPAGVEGYWVWGHLPEPFTLFKGITSLEPGTWRKVQRGGGISAAAFESVANLLDGHSSGAAGHNAAGTLRDALLDSVRHHLVADVPVGLFLSAGIDSSVLATLAAECGSALRTITIGFEEYRGSPADETVLAERVARQIGSRHTTVWIGRDDFHDAYGQFMEAMDQPTIDGLNTWLVARAARRLGLKVAISGLGADELFGGYPSFRQVPRMRRLLAPLARFPALGAAIRTVAAPAVRRVTNEKYAGVLEYGSTWDGAYMLRRAVRMPWEMRLPRPATGRVPAGLQEAHSVVSWLELTRYMRNQLLRDSDWAGMAHSLELRVPFVDVELSRFVARSRLTGQPLGKRDLTDAVRPPLPTELVNRAKTGFTVPVRDWMQQDARNGACGERGLRGWQREVLSDFANGWTGMAGVGRPMNLAAGLL
jgi:asparagine synthase (glutamine-hydrolysing)